ncbi:MAG: PBP1A family penicillin-binding protein [Nitrospirota bacterium]|nr:PBP1A family penicillin-binding protein [Nitrospirota bacterium]
MKLKLIVIFAFLSVLLGIIAGGYVAISTSMPSMEELKNYTSTVATKIYADDDVLIGELKMEKGVFVPIQKISRHLINAIIAVEDARFWKHRGIDYIAITRALYKDLLHARLKEGGSTITQQLAKVVFLTPEKTFKRKILEVVLAVKMEKNLSKNEILELYLNKIYFGHGAYGVEMASTVYFGKTVKHLNLAEAAMIAGLVKAPSSYSPYNNLAKAKKRQRIVLTRMEEEGFIRKSEKEGAYKQSLYLSSRRKGTKTYSYFIEYVRKYLEDRYGTDTVYKGGLKVYTTLDRKMQIAALNAVQNGLRRFDRHKGWRGPVKHREDIDFNRELKKKYLPSTVVTNPGDIYSGLVLKVTKNEAIIKTRGITGKLSIKDARWASKVLDSKTGGSRQLKKFTLNKILQPGDVVKVGIKSLRGKTVRLSLEQEPEVEGALVAIEPFTGFIRAMIGGYDFSKSEYNRAVYAKRQPGSAFKPIIYAAAMDTGYTPASIIVDEPVTYMGGPGGEWSPENYDHKYNGPTRLREALAYSRNVVTVKLVDSIGIGTVTDYAKMMGFQGDIPRNLSIALGSFNVTPLELAVAYNIFASNGSRVKPISIKYIIDQRGGVIESNEPAPEQLLSPQTSFLVTSMMEDVVKLGTGQRARALGRPVAGKTGTTNDYKDAWFAGYTTGLVSCVWVGFDDYKTLGHKETGARVAAPIWVSFMNNAVKGKPQEFHRPEGIVSYFIDPKSGLLSRNASGIEEYFKEETQPKAFSPSQSIWEIQDPSKFSFH